MAELYLQLWRALLRAMFRDGDGDDDTPNVGAQLDYPRRRLDAAHARAEMFIDCEIHSSVKVEGLKPSEICVRRTRG